MPYELFLALRHLRSGRRRSFAHITAMVAALGTACGVAALIIATALANGFRDELQDKILRGTAHITVAAANQKSIPEWRQTIRRISQVPGVRHATATRYDGALLVTSDSATYAVLRAVDPSSESAIAEVRRTLVEGSATPMLHTVALNNGPATTGGEARDESTEMFNEQQDEAIAEAAIPIDVVIGSELAARTALRVSDEAEIIVGARMPLSASSSGASSSLSGSSNQRRVKPNDSGSNAMELTPHRATLRVAGIFRSGLYEYDATWIYISLPNANALIGENDTASAISIEVADIFTAAEVAARVRASLGSGFVTVDWQEANRPLFAALELERRIVTLIIGLILILASLNITATLVLLVVERRGDIAILSTIGAPRRAIMLIFIIEGAVIGSVGVLCGVALGLMMCFVGNHFKLVNLPADVYSISYVPLHPRAADVMIAAGVAFAISLLATLHPARTATRVRPAEALRDK